MKTIPHFIILILLMCSTSCQKESIELNQPIANELTAVNGYGNLWSNIFLTIKEHRGMNSIRNRFYQSATTVFKNAVWRVTQRNYRGNPTVSKSDDGINWTFVSAIPNGRANNRIQLVTFNGELWLMGYRNSADRTSRPLYKSSDGIVWNSVPLVSDVYPFPENIFVFKNRLYMHVGRSLFYTENGSNWVAVTHSMPDPFREITKMLVFNKRFYAFTDGRWEDQQRIVHTAEIWESKNGRSWSRLPSTGPFSMPKEDYSVTAFKGKLWAIGGSYYGPIAGSSPRAFSYTRYNEIWYTDDAVNWQEYRGKIPFKAISKQAATVFSDKLWLFDGTPDGRITSPTYEIHH